MEKYVQIIDHTTTPPRCQFGTTEDEAWGTLLSTDDAPHILWYMRGELPARYPVPAIRHDVVLWDNNGNGTLLDEFHCCGLEGYPIHLTVLANVAHQVWEPVFDTRK